MLLALDVGEIRGNEQLATQYYIPDPRQRKRKGRRLPHGPQNAPRPRYGLPGGQLPAACVLAVKW